MENKNLAPIIACSLVFLFVGFAAGFFVMKSVGGSFSVNSPDENIVQAFSSKVIPNIYAAGKVEKISGRTLTLSAGSDRLDIVIGQDAKVNLLVKTDQTPGSSGMVQASSFEKIKVGDKLNIQVELLAGYKFQGTAVLIIPGN